MLIFATMQYIFLLGNKWKSQRIEQSPSQYGFAVLDHLGCQGSNGKKIYFDSVSYLLVRVVFSYFHEQIKHRVIFSVHHRVKIG